jgi:4-hydroxybenzoate polyprenyltransferase
MVTVFCLFLIFRLSDELKDVATDRALFPHRPLPSGRVLRSDAMLMMGLAIATAIGLNAQRAPALLAVLLVVGYVLLLHFYLFVPRFLKAHPVVNLAVHNPVFAAIAFYAATAYAATAATALDERALGSPEPSLVGLFVLSVWLPFLAWELLRKVARGTLRPDHDVYAPVLGRRGSLSIAVAAQTLALASFLVLATRLGLPAGAVGVALVGCLYAGFGYAAFALAPRRGAKRLTQSAEVFLACLPGGLALGPVLAP